MPTSFTAKLNQTITTGNLTEIEYSPYTFLGWFYSKDENGNGTGTQAKVGDKITADTTLYAKWKTATINFEPDFFNVASIKKYTGEKIAESEIISLSETGYTFEGWFDDYNNSIQLTTDYTVTEDTTFYAHFAPNTDTPYKVYHYQQNANDNLYTLKDTDNMTGTTETQTNAVAKAYEHFTAGTVRQTTIAADGSTIINIYYNRDTVTFTLNLEGGTLDGETGTITNTGKYGQTVNITAPTRTNYSFNGWNTTGGTLPATYETDGNYTAVWSAINGISVQVQIEDISVTKTQTGNTYTFSAETCDSYSWTLDDVEIATTQTCNIDISTFAKDTYILALEAKKGSKWYSYYAQIKVTE